MQARGLEREITQLLSSMNLLGGYPLSLVCTDQGLLIATAGEPLRSEILAGLTSLFDHIMTRAVRDLDFERVDEVTLTDRESRFIVRPVPVGGETRLFLVLQAPTKATWRSHTNSLLKRLTQLLQPLVDTPAANPETEAL